MKTGERLSFLIRQLKYATLITTNVPSIHRCSSILILSLLSLNLPPPSQSYGWSSQVMPSYPSLSEFFQAKADNIAATRVTVLNTEDWTETIKTSFSAVNFCSTELAGAERLSYNMVN